MSMFHIWLSHRVAYKSGPICAQGRDVGDALFVTWVFEEKNLLIIGHFRLRTPRSSSSISTTAAVVTMRNS